MTVLGLEGSRVAVAGWVDRHPAGRFAAFLLRELSQDDVTGLAAQMAYGFLFAAFPLLLFLVTALGFVGDALGVDHLVEQLLERGNLFLPAQASSVVDRYTGDLLTTRSPTFLTLGLLGTLWGAASGVGTLSKGLCRAYHVRHCRPFWERQLLSLLVILTLPPAGLALMALELLGRAFAAWVASAVGLGAGGLEVLTFLRWPVLFLVLLFGISLLYHVLPNPHHRYVWSLPGSAVAATGWLLLTRGFGLYVENFGHYDAVYGSFGAVIVFSFWLYLVGLVALVGAEVNAHLEPGQRQHWAGSRLLPAASEECGCGGR